MGASPKNWKISKIVPIAKPGREVSLDPSKYRPISLLNIGGTVLEKLLIKRIMHYLYKNDFLKENQYRFTPQKSTMDASMVAKQYIEH